LPQYSTYRGWNSSTNLPTGPTEVVRDDRASSTNLPTGPTEVVRDDRGHGYVETFTMTATPHLTNGVPDGTEAVSNLQTLSRDYYTVGGQLYETDDYFNLTGLTYSTATFIGAAGTNYYVTQFDYDARGRKTREKSPTGTITRWVYDGLSRLVSTWIGTNDSPAGGVQWSPSANTAPANMVDIQDRVYDGVGVGDSNLTKVTDNPGGSAAARVTQFFVDWRNRVVVSKQGAQASEDTSTHHRSAYEVAFCVERADKTRSGCLTLWATVLFRAGVTAAFRDPKLE
jgi:YD repeat-containing protein